MKVAPSEDGDGVCADSHRSNPLGSVQVGGLTITADFKTRKQHSFSTFLPLLLFTPCFFDNDVNSSAIA